MITREQVIDLLSAAAAYDNRSAGQANVVAWLESATRSRWTFEEALDGIHAHYATRTEFIMPGHITHWVRVARQDEHLRQAAREHTEPLAALPVGVDILGRRMSPALQAVHDDFNVIPCSRCHAPAGERCRNHDGTLTRIPHVVRLTGRHTQGEGESREPQPAMTEPANADGFTRNRAAQMRAAKEVAAT